TAASPIFAQVERRKKCPATRLVMKRARNDRMPLHSSATWIVKFGRLNTSPCRKTGMPRTENRTAVVSAELRCRNPMMASNRKERRRKKKEKTPSQNKPLHQSAIPKPKKKIPQHPPTNAKIANKN